MLIWAGEYIFLIFWNAVSITRYSRSRLWIETDVLQPNLLRCDTLGRRQPLLRDCKALWYAALPQM